MMKQKQQSKRGRKKGGLQPRYKWEKDDYQRMQELHFVLPRQFQFFCKLTGVTPKAVLEQFMTDLSCESWNRNKDEAVRQAAADYFIRCGYGQGFYSETELRSMFRELEAMGSLWPQKAGIKLIKRHAKWQDKYHDHWFKKWYYKERRKKP